MLQVIKIKLYPIQDQIIYINKLLGTSRFVYNQCLNYKINQYKETKKSTSLGETGKFLTSLKSEYQWIKESHSKVLQQSLLNLDKAYKNFFKNGSGFPRFKSKHSDQSCRFPVDAISGVFFDEKLYKREIPLIEFINNNIGRIKKIGGHKINNIFYPSNYLVEYFNIPEELENYFIEGGYCIRMIESQIKWWSENKEDLEDIIIANKYNL